MALHELGRSQCSKSHVATYFIKTHGMCRQRLFLVYTLPFPTFGGQMTPRSSSEDPRFIDLIDRLTMTTDGFITGLHTPNTQLSAQQAKQRVGAVPLVWSAALRVNHDITIQASIECVILFLHLPV
jgi:hypothetical protein